MNFDLQRLMSEATRLTRTGDLRAATAALRSALMGGRPGAAQPQRPEDDSVIEVEAREVRDTADSRAAEPAAAGSAGSSRATSQPFPHPPSSQPNKDEPSEPPFAKPAQQPSTGSFISGTHGEAANHRDYKLFIPPQAGQRPLPLVVMLHGCTQNPDDFAAGTAMNEAALAQGFYVLYPAQSQQANPQRCWNWFKHTHQQRGRGEPALIAGMTREVMARHAIDESRVYVAGLSAGGAMAAILGETYGDLYAAVGVHSGLAAGIAADLPSALSAMKTGGVAARMNNAPSGMPTIVFHGDADHTVHANNGEQVIAASVGRASVVETDRPQRGSARGATRRIYRADDGRVVGEYWLVQGAPHAWSGGSPRGSYTDASGPDASAEMLRFFFEHPKWAPR